jgi:hypothetical protein
MKRKVTNGKADIRLSPLDVGFDLRTTDTPVVLPSWAKSVSWTDDAGQLWRADGTPAELAAELRAAGFRVQTGD